MPDRPADGSLTAERPGAAVTLSIRSWQGRVDRVDATLHASLLTAGEGETPLARRLRVAVIAELAAADAEVAVALATPGVRLPDVVVPDRVIGTLARIG